jgi:hypothetical protein|tara:strand:- start:137 stop:760 length:624 start_codon:yes stop_codon:yes gene_type:complete
MGVFARGKQALAISDRSGLRFPYTEMVREWNGSLVHYSEYEPKQPQLQPKPVGNDPQALQNPRVQRDSTAQLILLNFNPFETIIFGGNTYVNVYSYDHQRSEGAQVRLRGAPQVIAVGAGGADAHNLQQFAAVQPFDGVSDIDIPAGYSILLGKIDSTGAVSGATTTDPIGTPVNYFYFQVADNATVGNVQGGGPACSAGPVTLEAL